MPALAPPGAIHNGSPAVNFGGIDSSRSYPDVRSFRKKIGLVIPATNTSMEHELWSLIFANQGPDGLRGVGLHTVNVITPRPKLETEADLLEYQKQFLGGLRSAVDTAKLSQPDYMIMGMSLEHILSGIDQIRAPMKELEAHTALEWSTWHDAAPAALKKFGARRIGLLTPFDRKGNESAKRLFEDLGFKVAATFGFSCANAMHIAHIPDWAKEKAILQHLAPPRSNIDAIVQCGTNMGLIDLAERLEPVIGIPMISINAALLWHALRTRNIPAPISGAGQLLRTC